MDEHKHQWLNVTTVADQPGTSRWECGCGETGYGFMGGPPAKAEPTLIVAFAAGLKAHLRTVGYHEFASLEHYYGEWSIEFDWPNLDAAIDAFAAEFQRGK